MNQYANEEVAWQRLVDLQREAEYSQFLATNGLPRAVHLALVLVKRIWWLAGLAMQRPPRPHPKALRVDKDQDSIVSDVA
jgi:hypothetical protein